MVRVQLMKRDTGKIVNTKNVLRRYAAFDPVLDVLVRDALPASRLLVLGDPAGHFSQARVPGPYFKFGWFVHVPILTQTKFGRQAIFGRRTNFLPSSIFGL